MQASAIWEMPFHPHRRLLTVHLPERHLQKGIGRFLHVRDLWKWPRGSEEVFSFFFFIWLFGCFDLAWVFDRV